MPDLVAVPFVLYTENSVRVSQGFEEVQKGFNDREVGEKEGDFMTETEAKGDVEDNGNWVHVKEG